MRRGTLLLAMIGVALVGAVLFLANRMEPAAPIEGDEEDNRHRPL